MRTTTAVGARMRRVFAPTLGGAVRLALAQHVAIFVLGTLAAFDAYGWDAGLDVWRRWDSTHYVRIAQEGYGGSEESGGLLLSAFLPLYPMAMRLLAPLCGGALPAGLLLSAIGALCASAALFELVRRDAGPLVARRAVAWLNLYPTSFFLVGAYTEATFLALVLGAFLAARRDRFVLASLAAAGAGAARITGIAVLPALALEALQATLERGDRRFLARAAPVLLIAPLGIAAYLAMNAVVYGHPLEFLEHQRVHWQHEPSTPWHELAAAATSSWNDPFTDDRFMLADTLVVSITLLGATVVYAALRLRASIALYAAVAGWLATAVSWNISAPRYAIGVWPLFWMLAAATRRRTVAAILGGASGALLLGLAIRFMNDFWSF